MCVCGGGKCEGFVVQKPFLKIARDRAVITVCSDNPNDPINENQTVPWNGRKKIGAAKWTLGKEAN